MAKNSGTAAATNDKSNLKDDQGVTKDAGYAATNEKSNLKDGAALTKDAGYAVTNDNNPITEITNRARPRTLYFKMAKITVTPKNPVNSALDPSAAKPTAAQTDRSANRVLFLERATHRIDVITNDRASP